jgi:hypothetical protein
MLAGAGLEGEWREGLEVGSGTARLEALRFAWWRFVEKKGGIFAGATATTTQATRALDRRSVGRGRMLLPELAGRVCADYASHRGHGRSKDMTGRWARAGWMCKLQRSGGFPTLHGGRKASATEGSMAGALIRRRVETGCSGAVRLPGLGLLFCC